MVATTAWTRPLRELKCVVLPPVHKSDNFGLFSLSKRVVMVLQNYCFLQSHCQELALQELALNLLPFLNLHTAAQLLACT
jgi:hypothetical protein